MIQLLRIHIVEIRIPLLRRDIGRCVEVSKSGQARKVGDRLREGELVEVAERKDVG